MPGHYVHHIDPIIATIGGMHLWWYGLSYSLGFLNAHLFLRRNRDRLGLSLADVYELSFLLALGVLAGGRGLVAFRHEWAFYRDHLALVPAVWIGGLATHGLIIGGFVGVMLFCVIRRRPFRPIFDALAMPAAFILGCGRIGNFIDGQIVGSVTTLPWGVQFPEAEGFRHPVVLYDGLKNFLIIPILWSVQRRGVPSGRIGSLFVLLYAALRIPIDLLREYPISFLFLPAGQTFNVLMALTGLTLLVKNVWWPAPAGPTPVGRPVQGRHVPSVAVRLAFAGLVLLALIIPSDATRDIPARYGRRHAGLTYSRLYPRIGVEPQLVSEAASRPFQGRPRQEERR
jgi:phosphatidylglycerol---prolipoprotein diacylglyceryl transferase